MSKRDVFDFVGEHVAKHFLATAKAFERMRGPFKAGALLALEEFWFRSTGKHVDWAHCEIDDEVGVVDVEPARRTRRRKRGGK